LRVDPVSRSVQMQYDEEGRMSTTVRNKTQKPLSVPLSRGKVLHLGPLKTGEIAFDDAERPGVKALIDSGALEVVAVGPGHAAEGRGGGGGRPGAQGHPSSTGGHRSGDR
jgi:hypothetical protein